MIYFRYEKNTPIKLKHPKNPKPQNYVEHGIKGYYDTFFILKKKYNYQIKASKKNPKHANHPSTQEGRYHKWVSHKCVENEEHTPPMWKYNWADVGACD